MFVRGRRLRTCEWCATRMMGGRISNDIKEHNPVYLFVPTGDSSEFDLGDMVR